MKRMKTGNRNLKENNSMMWFGRILTVLACAWLAAGLPVRADHTPKVIPLDELITEPQFWEWTVHDLAEPLGSGRFAWISEQRNALRAGSESPARFAGLPMEETILRFTDDRISQVFLSFFNRGDSELIEEEDYLQRVAALTEWLTQWHGSPGRDMSGRGAVTTTRAAYTHVWSGEHRASRLEHAFSRPRREGSHHRIFLPEFITLTIIPPAPSERRIAGDDGVRVGLLALRDRVQRGENGDRWLDTVPMVHQGEKGYCAVAAVERVLRYYDIDFNQHLLAQRALTEAGGGTDTESLLRALHAMSAGLNVRVCVLSQFDVNELGQLVARYNREANRRRLPRIPWPPDGPVNLSDLFYDIDIEVFRAAREPTRMAMTRYQDTIREKIDAGYPVLWGVMLGLVPETPMLPQARGGHLRMIIGYNPQTNEVLYSDTWGAGHELKRMDFEDAHAITLSLFTLEPR